MRMKKILFIAAVALAAAACGKTYNVGPDTQKAIGFSTWNETLTKARATASDNTAFKTGDVFDVFGTKKVGSTNHPVFTGDDVTATVTGTSVSWDYVTKRYWDPAASQYTFYAVLPANKVNTSGYANDGLFSGSFAFGDPTVAANSFANDIMVADETVVNGVENNTTHQYSYSSASPVEMVFNHAASCVDVYVKKDAALGTAVLTVTDLSIADVKTEGTFAVSAYSASKPTVGWSNQTGDGDYTVLSAGSVVCGGSTTYDPSTHAATNTGDGAGKIFDGYVFMPQTLTADGQKMVISYTIKVGDEEPNVYKDVDVYFAAFKTTDTDNNSGSTAITSWDANTHYIYYITIGADNVITFTASVSAWATTQTGYQYILK